MPFTNSPNDRILLGESDNDAAGILLMRFLLLLLVSFCSLFAQSESVSLHCATEQSLQSPSSPRGSSVDSVNRTGAPVRVYLRNEWRHRVLVRSLDPNEEFSQAAAEGEPFVVTDNAFGYNLGIVS